MAEEGFAGAGAGAETRTCHSDLLGWGRTPAPQGGSANG